MVIIILAEATTLLFQQAGVAHNGLLIYIMIKVVEINLLSLACRPANVTYGLSQLACPATEIFYVRLGGGVFEQTPPVDRRQKSSLIIIILLLFLLVKSKLHLLSIARGWSERNVSLRPRF